MPDAATQPSASAVPPSGLTDDLLKKLGQEYSDIGSQFQTQKARAEADRPALETKLKKAEVNLDELKPPQLLPLPEQPKPTQTDPWQVFGSPAMILAVLGSALTQTPLTSALNAGANVMKAYKQNDMAAADYNMEVWKTSVQNTLRLQDYQDKIYRASLDKFETDKSQAWAELQANSAALGDAPMHELAVLKNKEDLIKLIDDRKKQANSLESMEADAFHALVREETQANGGKVPDAKRQLELLEQVKAGTAKPKWQILTDPGTKDAGGNPIQYRYDADTGKATTLSGEPYTPTGAAKLSTNQQSTPLTDDAIAYAGTIYRKTGVMPAMGMSAASGDRQKIINWAASQNPDASKAVLALAGQVEFKGQAKSVAQLTTMLGATKQAVSQLDYNIDNTKKEIEKLGSSDLSPIINAIARGEEKWAGDPAYSSLFYFMHATAVESARLLSGGQASVAQLHQGAMDEAKQWASVNMTPASFDSVAEAMHNEGEQRIKTYEDAIKQQTPGYQNIESPPAAASAPPTFINGEIYEDANGNRAMYKDGQWVPQ